MIHDMATLSLNDALSVINKLLKKENYSEMKIYTFGYSFFRQSP